jgi:hypothetical protein
VQKPGCLQGRLYDQAGGKYKGIAAMIHYCSAPQPAATTTKKRIHCTTSRIA